MFKEKTRPCMRCVMEEEMGRKWMKYNEGASKEKEH